MNVPTTVFTSLEYGCCGLSEEDANEQFGEENLDVYHKNFWPLEWTVAGRSEKHCYAKLIVRKKDDKVRELKTRPALIKKPKYLRAIIVGLALISRRRYTCLTSRCILCV